MTGRTAASGQYSQLMRTSAAVISFSPLHRDARVQRQIQAVNAICDVTAIGLTDPCIDGVLFVDVSARRRMIPGNPLGACEKFSGRCY